MGLRCLAKLLVGASFPVSAVVRAEAAWGWPKHTGGPRATKLCPAKSFSGGAACRGELRAQNCRLVRLCELRHRGPRSLCELRHTCMLVGCGMSSWAAATRRMWTGSPAVLQKVKAVDDDGRK